MTAATIEELEGRLRSLERLILAGSHGLSHEIGGVDQVRPQWANGAIGTKVNRQRTTLAASGITATEVQGADPHIKIAFDASYSPTFAGLTLTGSTIQLNNPAGTFKYTLTAAALLADRVLNLPLITATDVLAALGLAQTWTALQSFGTNLGGTLQTAAQPNVTSLGTLTTATQPNLTAGKATVLATARTINSVSFDGSANIAIPMLLAFSNGRDNTSAATTYYLTAAVAGTTESATEYVIPAAVTFTKMYIIAGGAPGGTDTYIYTVRKNAVDTAITATITGAATQANVTNQTATFAAGDTITVSLALSATAAANNRHMILLST